MKGRAIQIFSAVILITVVFPSIIFSAPLLFIGIIPAGAAFDAVATNPAVVLEILRELAHPKSLMHAAPLVVPFGFVGLFSLTTAWGHLAKGASISALNFKLIHPGMAAGLTSLLIVQSFFEWKFHKLYLPLVGFLVFYAIYFYSLLTIRKNQEKENDL